MSVNSVKDGASGPESARHGDGGQNPKGYVLHAARRSKRLDNIITSCSEGTTRHVWHIPQCSIAWKVILLVCKKYS